MGHSSDMAKPLVILEARDGKNHRQDGMINHIPIAPDGWSWPWRRYQDS